MKNDPRTTATAQWQHLISPENLTLGERKPEPEDNPNRTHLKRWLGELIKKKLVQ